MTADTRRSHWFRPRSLVAVLLAANTTAAQAQATPRGTVVYGTVRSAAESVAVLRARVAIRGDEAHAVTTDTAGAFRLVGAPPGPATLVVTRDGFATTTREIVVTGDSLRINLYLARSAALLPGVIITASSSGATSDAATTSTISRAAIDHLQASSLADVLQLLPGQLSVNPTLAGPAQSLLRQNVYVGATGGAGLAAQVGAQNANALGTSLIVDGVPTGNNANMQSAFTVAQTNSTGTSVAPFPSVAGRGDDLRAFSVDNIEFIDVVRGVPSARYGDLTSGVILVTSRAGTRTPELRLRVNPQTLDLSGLGGWSSASYQGLSVDGNLARSYDDVRSINDQYTRANTQVAWTRPWSAAFTTTTRLTIQSQTDERLANGTLASSLTTFRSSDTRTRGSLRALFEPAASTKRVEVAAAFTRASQSSFYRTPTTRELFPITTATTDTTVVGFYDLTSYVAEERVTGRPRDLYVRADLQDRFDGLGASHTLVTGVEYRDEWNAGAGIEFDPQRPLRQLYGVADRPRAFNNVPRYRQAAVYVEDRARLNIWGTPALVQAGLRADDFRAGRHVGTPLSPRLNVIVDAGSRFRVRASIGTASKAPTLSQLSPGPRYFDLVNFNYYAINPAERLGVVTTRVVQPDTRGLRPYTSHKGEIGIDWNALGTRGTVIAFRDITTDIPQVSRRIAPLSLVRFDTLRTIPGQPPELDSVPLSVAPFVAAYDVYENRGRASNRGIEATIDAKEWAAVHTSLSATASYTRSTIIDGATYFDPYPLYSSTGANRVGVYAGGAGTSSATAISNVRLVHHQPAVGLVVSVLAQTVWIQQTRAMLGPMLPMGYMDRQAVFTPLTAAEAALPENAGLRGYNPDPYLYEAVRPAPTWLFNLRVSKTLTQTSQLNFYANNALAERPLRAGRIIGPDEMSYARRNPPLFFGAELVYAFGGSRRR